MGGRGGGVGGGLWVGGMDKLGRGDEEDTASVHGALKCWGQDDAV